MINDLWCFACNFERNQPDVSFNDIYAVDGNLAVVTGYDCLKQLAAQALWLWYGEWSMNTSIGVTYRRLLGKTGNKQALMRLQIENALYAINNYIAAEYLPKYGIKKILINSYDLNRSAKLLTISVDLILNTNKKVQVLI